MLMQKRRLWSLWFCLLTPSRWPHWTLERQEGSSKRNWCLLGIRTPAVAEPTLAAAVRQGSEYRELFMIFYISKMG